MTEVQIRRYARHISLAGVGIRGQQRLLAATVVVRASADPADHCAAITLAASGVGRLVFVGGDDLLSLEEVERSLVFAPSDVGKSRFDALAQRIAAQNTDVSVERATATSPAPLAIEATTTVAAGLAAGCAAAAACIIELANPSK